MQLRLFDPAAASQAEWQAAYRFNTLIRNELSPEEPVLPLDAWKAQVSNIPPVVRVTFYALWEQEEVIGWLDLTVPATNENRHLVDCMPKVHREYRRRGLGSSLLAVVAREARQGDRRLIAGFTRSTIPAGEEFARATGANIGLLAHHNELDMRDLDPALMRRWVEGASECASDFDLGLWEGPYPEENLDEISVLMDLYNAQPMGDLEVEEQHFSPEQIREMDRSMQARGINRWTYYVREKSTGKLAGFTEIFIRPATPGHLTQGLTAVFPQYRNRGLGRWLKGTMTEKILRELPDTKKIVTGNAEVNAPMLKINTEMGFKSTATETIWQVSIDRVEEYLSARNITPAPVPS